MLKELEKLKEENEVLRKELEAAYKYNKEINKWWKFKLERLELSHSHAIKILLPWKKLAKKYFKQNNNVSKQQDIVKSILDKKHIIDEFEKSKITSCVGCGIFYWQ